VSALNEMIDLIKEQNKAKLTQAIEKMKEFKGIINLKTEENSVGSARISELEEALVRWDVFMIFPFMSIYIYIHMTIYIFILN
jgi:hypothetical protein